jgi:hypothetical protein
LLECFGYLHDGAFVVASTSPSHTRLTANLQIVQVAGCSDSDLRDSDMRAINLAPAELLQFRRNERRGRVDIPLIAQQKARETISAQKSDIKKRLARSPQDSLCVNLITVAGRYQPPQNVRRTPFESSGGFSGGFCCSTCVCPSHVPVFRQKKDFEL